MSVNNLVQITLNADQEKYDLAGDESITFIDANSYYIGQVASQHHGWIVLESVDQDGNRGGIVFIRANQVAKIENDTPTLHYYATTAIRDPFKMQRLNRSVLDWDFTDIHDLLINVADAHPLVTFEVNNGQNYTGVITQLNQEEVRILERNETTLEHFATVIPLKDIVCIDVSSIDDRLFVGYLKQRKEYRNDLNLVELYFDYTFDDQFGSFAIGKVLKYDDDNLLLESLNELGQVESIAIIARNHIIHTGDESERLKYFNYLVEWQKKNNSFDPDHLERSVNIAGTIPSPAEVIEDWPLDRAVKISDAIYHYPDRVGLIADRTESSFDLKILSEYDMGETSDHDYEDLISVDLAGSEMIKMQQILDNGS